MVEHSAVGVGDGDLTGSERLGMESELRLGIPQRVVLPDPCAHIEFLSP
jgi:hypothetical protein